MQYFLHEETIYSPLTNQEIFNSSELMRDEAWLTSFSAPWVNEHNGLISVVSSAYKMKFTFLLTECISFTYMRNNKGLKTDPWGTTRFQFSGRRAYVLILYILPALGQIALKPLQSSAFYSTKYASFDNSIWWFSVSNASDRHKNTENCILFWSIPRWIPSVNSKAANLIECCFLKPFFSNTLHKDDSRDMWR